VTNILLSHGSYSSQAPEPARVRLRVFAVHRFDSSHRCDEFSTSPTLLPARGCTMAFTRARARFQRRVSRQWGLTGHLCAS